MSEPQVRPSESRTLRRTVATGALVTLRGAEESDDRLAEALSMAFLVLLESLSPVERSVFLLREIFDYEFAEIGQILGKCEVNCRQLLRRAR